MGEIRVQVHLKNLAASVIGKDMVEVDLPEKNGFRELVNILDKEYGKSLSELLFTHKGELRPRASVQVNGRDIDEMGGIDSPLDEGCQVTIAISLRAVVGG